MSRMISVEHNKQTAGGETLKRLFVETGYQVVSMLLEWAT